VDVDAIVDSDELTTSDKDNTGYQGTIITITAEYADINTTNVDVTQEQDTAIAYVFASTGAGDIDGILDPKGSAVIYLYLSNAWSPRANIHC